MVFSEVGHDCSRAAQVAHTSGVGVEVAANGGSGRHWLGMLGKLL